MRPDLGGRDGRPAQGADPSDSQYASPIVRDHRLRLIREQGITVVLDVGANAGQWASRLREDGYVGTIVSFEPLRQAYEELHAAAAEDPDWETHRTALGEVSGVANINVSANSYSSSFLPITKVTLDAAPDAAYVSQEEVAITRLDLLDLPSGRKMLKADVQGTEPAVIRGAHDLLPEVHLVELEMSLVPIYAGQELAPAVCSLMRARGFAPVALEPSWANPHSGEILHVDAIFASIRQRTGGDAQARLPR
jgi:FkbM family methyltransferase